MLQEISRRAINLTKYEDTEIIWHNNVLTVRCDTGLHLFDFSYNLNCLDKTIDFLESKILTSKCSPATELFPKHAMKERMKNMDFTDMIADPALWPHSAKLMEAAIITAFEWSPVDFCHNNECVLATLNSAGNIDIYCQERYTWTQLENLSIKLKDAMNLKSVIPPVSCIGPLDVNEVKKAAYALEAGSICWAPMLNADNSCYFVTGQKNGCIIIWLLKCINIGVDVKLEGYINDNVEQIVAMTWIPTHDNQFKLVCSNVLGQIFAYDCRIVNNIFEHISTYTLWNCKDKMMSVFMHYEFADDSIILAYNKHRHLILQMIDYNCNVLSQNITNINDQKITALTKTNKGLYVSTINRVVYLVKYTTNNGNLHVQFIQVEMKVIPSEYELYGFDYSVNDTILALALLDRTVLCRKQPLKLHIVLYTETGHGSELEMIVNNPTKTLTHMWDTIESLRCKTLKLRILPSFDYSKLYEQAKMEVYHAKVFLIVMNLYNNLETTIQNGSKGVLPETTVDDVKTSILTSHAAELMKKLYIICFKDNVKDKLAFESYVMAGIYLGEYCQRSKKNLNELLAPDIVDAFHNKKNDLKHTCQCCDETLKGFVCKDGHLNLFCSLTFTMIEGNHYLICRCCGLIARFELLVSKPKCVFCDIYLCFCYLPS